MDELTTLRQRRDRWFKASPESPIPPEERAAFTGLRYYPESPALRLTLPLEQFAAKDPVKLATSTGAQQDYLRWGEVRFSVEGLPARLTVYYASWGAYFIPFVDATSGDETYAVGRYLEPEDLGDGTLLVDFNRAYQPFCAYSDSYSCPIPPAENRIGVPIRAGERL